MNLVMNAELYKALRTIIAGLPEPECVYSLQLNIWGDEVLPMVRLELYVNSVVPTGKTETQRLTVVPHEVAAAHNWAVKQGKEPQ